MPRSAGTAGDPPPGLLGLYALAMMEREGAIHGYGVAERIAQRTEGAWRPGAGAVYPSLRKLEVRGLARGRPAGKRREYRITPQGRLLLRRIRHRQAAIGSTRLDLSSLWAEVVGSRDLDSFLLLRLRRTLDAVARRVEIADERGVGDLDLRAEVSRDLVRALAILRGRSGPGVSRSIAHRGRVR